jgi:hypothetical protein
MRGSMEGAIAGPHLYSTNACLVNGNLPVAVWVPVLWTQERCHVDLHVAQPSVQGSRQGNAVGSSSAQRLMATEFASL